LPGSDAIAVLGALFRSRDFVNSQTELMVIVTPFIVRAVAQKDLSRPMTDSQRPSDPQADLIGNINRIYGVPGRVEPAGIIAALWLYHRLNGTRTRTKTMTVKIPVDRIRAYRTRSACWSCSRAGSLHAYRGSRDDRGLP